MSPSVSDQLEENINEFRRSNVTRRGLKRMNIVERLRNAVKK